MAAGSQRAPRRAEPGAGNAVASCAARVAPWSGCAAGLLNRIPGGGGDRGRGPAANGPPPWPPSAPDPLVAVAAAALSPPRALVLHPEKPAGAAALATWRHGLWLQVGGHGEPGGERTPLQIRAGARRGKRAGLTETWCRGLTASLAARGPSATCARRRLSPSTSTRNLRYFLATANPGAIAPEDRALGRCAGLSLDRGAANWSGANKPKAPPRPQRTPSSPLEAWPSPPASIGSNL